jgi:hypothetical protein
MRTVAVLACALLLSGCAAGTDATLTAQDAKSKLAAMDHGLSALATAELRPISEAAQAYLAANGSMAGFAANLRDTQPSVAAPARVLSDAEASVSVGTGQCLTVMLPSGQPTPTAC